MKIIQPKIISSVYGRIEQVLSSRPAPRYNRPGAGRGQAGQQGAADILIAAINKNRRAKKESELGDRGHVIYQSRSVPPKVKLKERENPGFADIKSLMESGTREAFIHENPDVFGYLLPFLERYKKYGSIHPSEWMQDPFIMIQLDQEFSAFLSPYLSTRVQDRFITPNLAQWPWMKTLVWPTRWWLEGGNILAGDEYVLLGKDLLAKNILEMFRTSGGESLKEFFKNAGGDEGYIAKFETELKDLFGVEELIWIGGKEAHRPDWDRSRVLNESFQPVFHIDLFLTLGGKTEQDGVTKELIFVGDLHEARAELGNMWNGQSDEEKTEYERMIVRMNQIRKGLAEKSTGKEFHTVKLPMLLHKGTFYSYNNCLVEVFEGKKFAYLPQYRVPDGRDHEGLNPAFEKLNGVVERIFGDYGFEVSWISADRHFRRIAKRMGSLHCVSKVLRRGRVD